MELVDCTRACLRSAVGVYEEASTEWLAELQTAASATEVRVDAWTDPLRLGCAGPSSTECLALLKQAANEPKLQAMLAAVRAVLHCGSLPWKQPKDLSDDYTKTMAAALRSVMLVGDVKYGAVISSPSMYAGFWHVGPGVIYPCHNHESAEEFLILNESDAEWRVDGVYDEPTVLPAGAPFGVRQKTGRGSDLDR